jgi:hypothetical protein
MSVLMALKLVIGLSLTAHTLKWCVCLKIFVPKYPMIIMTMNAGAIPKDSWIQDIKIGGGRIIGEACHYIDLMRYLSGAKSKH